VESDRNSCWDEKINGDGSRFVGEQNRILFADAFQQFVKLRSEALLGLRVENDRVRTRSHLSHVRKSGILDGDVESVFGSAVGEQEVDRHPFVGRSEQLAIRRHLNSGEISAVDSIEFIF